MSHTPEQRIYHLLITVALIITALFSGLLLGCTGAPPAVLSATGLAPDDLKIAPPAALTTAPDPSGQTIFWPHSTSDLAPDPQVTFGRFDNGVGYVLLPNQTPRQRVSLHLVVQAGSYHETEAQRGLAHFLEHLLFCGSTHFSPGELVRFFQGIGMRFGPDVNARTGFYQTVYDVLLPDGEAASLHQGLLVLQDYAQGALLLPEEVDRERGVVLAEMYTRDSAAYRTHTAGLAFAFPEARFATRLPMGVEEVLKTAEREDLKDFYDTWYRPERLIVVMVGDIEVPAARELIAEYFAALAPRAPPRADPLPGRVQHSGLKAFYHHEAEMGHTTVSIETVGMVPDHQPNLAYQQRQLRQETANRIVMERLNARLQQPDPPFTRAQVHSGVFLRHIFSARLGAQTRPDQWEPTLDILEQHLRQALKFGFEEREVSRARQEILAALEKEDAGAATRESQMLANQLIDSLNAQEVFQAPQQRLEMARAYLATVTPEAVHEAFQQAWEAPHRLILVTGNAEIAPAADSDRPAEDHILARFQASAAQPIQPYMLADRVSFPYLDSPALPVAPITRHAHDDLGIESLTFANGVQLHLKPTPFKQSQVLLQLSFGAGRQSEPPHQPGLAELTRAVINEGGIGRLNRQELQEALAGFSVELELNISDERFHFNGQSLTQDLETLLQLLVHYLRDPAFRPSAHRLALERLQQHHDNLTRTVEGTMALEGRRFLAGGDYRFGFPNLESLQRLTLSDVQAWLAPALQQAPLELALVGDFEVDPVIALVERYLGSLPLAPPAEILRPGPGPRFPAGESLHLTIASRIPKALVVLAHSGEDFWDIQRTRRLSILAEIYANRLRETIREQMGAAYSPFAWHQPSRAYRGYGLFQAMIPVHPNQVAAILQAAPEVAASLRQQPITADELRRSLDPVLTSIRDRVQTNEYWLSSVLVGLSQHPEQLAWSRNFLSDYAAISLAEMHQLAEHYLDHQEAAWVVIVPEVEKGAG